MYEAQKNYILWIDYVLWASNPNADLRFETIWRKMKCLEVPNEIASFLLTYEPFVCSLQEWFMSSVSHNFTLPNNRILYMELEY
jgi:hypothetical protein